MTALNTRLSRVSSQLPAVPGLLILAAMMIQSDNHLELSHTGEVAPRLTVHPQKYPV